MSDLTRPGASPFDAIRREDANGERWSARDLMPVMAYPTWQHFRPVIERAIQAAKNTGVDVTSNFTVKREVSGQRGPAREDFWLTRYAAYLVAMNGDPRKPEVAAAQSYFAIKTREAETAPAVQHQIPQTLSEALRMAADNLDRAELAEKQVAELETTTAAQGKELETARPKAEYVDAFVRGGMDGTPLRVLAGQLNVPERVLRQHLMDCGVIYRKFLGRRWSGTHQRHIDEYQYYAYSERRPWFVPVDLPNTPRLPGGQMRTALHVTPVGKVRILALLKRRPISNPPKGGAA